MIKLSNLLSMKPLFRKLHLEKMLRMKKRPVTKNLILDVDQNQLINTFTGEVRRIEPRLVGILTILLDARGQVVPRNQIIQEIWGNYNSGEQLLTHSVAMLRREVGTHVIKTIPKKGYLLKESTKSKHSLGRYYIKIKPIHWAFVFALYIMARVLFFPHH